MATVPSTTQLKPKTVLDQAFAAPPVRAKDDDVRSFRDELNERLEDRAPRDANRSDAARPSKKRVEKKDAAAPAPREEVAAEPDREEPVAVRREEKATGDAAAPIEPSDPPVESEPAAAPVLEVPAAGAIAADPPPVVAEPAPQPQASPDEAAVAAAPILDAPPSSEAPRKPEPAIPAANPSTPRSEIATPAPAAPRPQIDPAIESVAAEHQEAAPDALVPRRVPGAVEADAPDETAASPDPSDAAVAAPDNERRAAVPAEAGARAKRAEATIAALESAPPATAERTAATGAIAAATQNVRVRTDREIGREPVPVESGGDDSASLEPEFDAAASEPGSDPDAAPPDGRSLATTLRELAARTAVASRATPRAAETGAVEFGASGPGQASSPGPTSALAAEGANTKATLDAARAFGAATAPAAVPVQRILAQVQRAIRPGMQELRIRLDPPSLGSLTLKFALEGDSLSVIVRASRPEVVEALKNDLAGFADTLAKSGIDLTSLDVSLDAGSGDDAGSFREKLEDAGVTNPHPVAARTAPRATQKAERSHATSALLDVMA